MGEVQRAGQEEKVITIELDLKKVEGKGNLNDKE